MLDKEMQELHFRKTLLPSLESEDFGEPAKIFHAGTIADVKTFETR
jgi:hypothetical protein